MKKSSKKCTKERRILGGKIVKKKSKKSSK